MSSADSAQWLLAAKEEYQSIIDNKTWELCELPPGRQALTGKWVFKRKLNPDGLIARFKARYVVHGYKQVEGIDFNETFSPVVWFTSERILLALAAEKGLLLHHMDVKTAFLNGYLEEEIYIAQPEGFEDPNNPDKVCLLKRPLYGLKQSAREWNKRIHVHLVRSGFTQSTADPNVYILHLSKDFAILALYVNDALIVATSQTALEKVKNILNSEFKMSDLGRLSFFLGAQIHTNPDGSIFMHQAHYVRQVLEKFGMTDCKHVSTPMSVGAEYTNEQSPKTESEKQAMTTYPYNVLTGVLLWLSGWTRPDCTSATRIFSRFISNPGMTHWVGAKRVLRYVKGTMHLGILYKRTNAYPRLVSFSDSDWASDKDTRHSVSANCTMLCGGAISWMSKRQAVIALSSTEAEYTALTAAAQEAMYNRHFLESIGVPQKEPTVIYADNQSSIALAMNPVHHARTRHLDVKQHFIRQAVSSKQVKLQYVQTESNVADLFTKPLPRDRHLQHCESLGLVELKQPTTSKSAS